MKLKDFKDNPERYEEIKKMCEERNIEVDDETDVNEILKQNNSVEAKARRITKELDNKRMGR